MLRQTRGWRHLKRNLKLGTSLVLLEGMNSLHLRLCKKSGDLLDIVREGSNLALVVPRQAPSWNCFSRSALQCFAFGSK